MQKKKKKIGEKNTSSAGKEVLPQFGYVEISPHCWYSLEIINGLQRLQLILNLRLNNRYMLCLYGHGKNIFFLRLIYRLKLTTMKYSQINLFQYIICIYSIDTLRGIKSETQEGLNSERRGRNLIINSVQNIWIFWKTNRVLQMIIIIGFLILTWENIEKIEEINSSSAKLYSNNFGLDFETDESRVERKLLLSIKFAGKWEGRRWPE